MLTLHTDIITSYARWMPTAYFSVSLIELKFTKKGKVNYIKIVVDTK